jgi:hypothetical protein
MSDSPQVIYIGPKYQLHEPSEWLKQQPKWTQEGRAPTAKEYTEWSRSQPHACQEYIALEPMGYYNGRCQYYENFGRPCGVPFVRKLNCKMGVVEEGKTHKIPWKDFRRNADKEAKSPTERERRMKEANERWQALYDAGYFDDKGKKLKPSTNPKVSPPKISVTRSSSGVIVYECETCHENFESKRTRNGPKICAQCIGVLRAQGKGPKQMQRKEE